MSCFTESIVEETAIDWTAKESVKANIRTMVRRILRKYGYPPDRQEKATQTILQQAGQRPVFGMHSKNQTAKTTRI
jgi:hypothetical protein